jgi:hypothetical protein
MGWWDSSCCSHPGVLGSQAVGPTPAHSFYIGPAVINNNRDLKGIACLPPCQWVAKGKIETRLLASEMPVPIPRSRTASVGGNSLGALTPGETLGCADPWGNPFFAKSWPHGLGLAHRVGEVVRG